MERNWHWFLWCVWMSFFVGVSWGLSEEPLASLRIEPVVEKIPANHLRFYLHFSEPMERGDIFRYLRLVEIGEGEEEIAEVPDPFREVELWDETFTRLTLWLQPEHQKSEASSPLDMDSVLEEGKRYRLEVSPDWGTEAGGKLGGILVAGFEAGKIDKSQPDPKKWGSGYGMNREGAPLVIVHTDEVLDPESARRFVKIWLGDHEVPFWVRRNTLQFSHPPQKLESFRVLVDPRLEDLAGNRVASPQKGAEPTELTFPRKIVFPATSPDSQ